MHYHHLQSKFICLLIIFNFCFPLNILADSISNEPTLIELRIHGSNTIGEKFAPDLVERFLIQNEYKLTNKQSNISQIERRFVAEALASNVSLSIELFSHGSSTGFADLKSKTTDIAMSSRRIKLKEKEILQVVYPSMTSDTTEHIIAFDALAVIVHPENPVQELSLAQLASIFSGELSNWKALGGIDQTIAIKARDNNSGTFDTFKGLVLKPAKLSLHSKADRFESSTSLSNAVIADVGAIGFVGISHTKVAKVLAISQRSGALAVFPDEHTIGTEDYPLSRKLYLYLPSEIQNTLAHEFVKFSKSTLGQLLAKRSQLVSFYPTKSKPSYTNVRLKGAFNNLRTFGERLSISFQLKDQKFNAKNRRDMERLKRFHSANSNKKIVLAGFESLQQNESMTENLEDWLTRLRIELNESNIEPWEVRVAPSSFIGEKSEILNQTRQRIEIWAI